MDHPRFRNILSGMLKHSERHFRTDMIYLARSGFWSNLGTITVSMGSLALYMVFSRYLPKEAYGTYQYLLSIGAVIGAFTLTGMNASVTRAVARGYEGTLKRSMQIQFKWNILPLAGSWALGAYYLSQDNITLGWGLVLIGIFVPLNNALNTYGAFLGGKKDFRRGFLLSLWWNIPYYVVVGIVALFFDAAILLLAANLISQSLGLIVAYRRTLAAYNPNNEEDPEALKYGKHLSLMGLFGSIVSQADNILAFHFLGAASLAIYSFATAVPDRIGALLKFIPSAALPKFAERTPPEIREGLFRRLLIGTGAALALALVYVFAAEMLFTILFPNYLNAVAYSQWYALALGTTMSGVLVGALTASGNVRSLYIYNTVTPMVQIALLIVCVSLFGLWGLIGARVAGNVFALFLAAVLYWRID